MPTADLFAQRLNRLCEQMTPVGRSKALSSKEIARGVEDVTGQKISASLINYYLSGARQPSLRNVVLLAKYFGVPTSYFTDDDVTEVDADLERLQLWKELRRANVQMVATRLLSAEFSDDDLQLLAAFLDRIKPTRPQGKDRNGGAQP